jgi:hypothetical protein
MKITKGLLKKIIAEECAAMEPMGPMDGESSGIIVVGGDEHGMHPDGHHDEEEMHSPGDVEGLATRAMAAIHDLATAAGVDLSTTVGTEGEDEMMAENQTLQWGADLPDVASSRDAGRMARKNPVFALSRGAPVPLVDPEEVQRRNPGTSWKRQGAADSEWGSFTNLDPYDDYTGVSVDDLGPDVSTRRGARQAQRADRRDLKRMAGSEPRQPGGLSQALSQGRQVRSDIRGGMGLSDLQQQAQTQRDDQSAFEAMPAWVQAMDDTTPSREPREQGGLSQALSQGRQVRSDIRADRAPRSRRRLAEYGLGPASSAAEPPEADLGTGGMASAVKGLGTAGAGAAASRLEEGPVQQAMQMMSDALAGASPTQKREFAGTMLEMLGVDPSDLGSIRSGMGNRQQASGPAWGKSPGRPSRGMKESQDPFKRLKSVAFNSYGSNRED